MCLAVRHKKRQNPHSCAVRIVKFTVFQRQGSDGGGAGHSVGSYRASLHAYGGTFDSVTCHQRRYHCLCLRIVTLIPIDNRNQTVFPAGFALCVVGGLEHKYPLCSAAAASPSANPARKSMSSSYCPLVSALPLAAHSAVLLALPFSFTSRSIGILAHPLSSSPQAERICLPYSVFRENVLS